MKFLNISGYKFVDLEGLEELQTELKTSLENIPLKGFMLISPEGINFSMAGTKEDIETYLELLKQHSEFEDITFKESYSEEQPFGKLKIRVKNHIIPFNAEVRPQDNRAPTISPQELKNWYQEKKDFVLLDVRNDYELVEGKFENTMELPLKYFRWFPDVFEKLPEATKNEMKNKPIVTVCTGGIKTEKATLWLREQGYTEACQLEGGILKYLDECGDSHFEGRCFVFDERVSLDGQLNEFSPDDHKPSDPFFDKKHGRL